MTQAERVLRAARRFNGVCQADFLLPDVCDGGPPITRVAARLHELDAAGHAFECIGWRSKTKVFRLVSESSGVELDAVPAAPPVKGRVQLSTEPESLFPVEPDTAHWREVA